MMEIYLLKASMISFKFQFYQSYHLDVSSYFQSCIAVIGLGQLSLHQDFFDTWATMNEVLLNCDIPDFLFCKIIHLKVLHEIFQLMMANHTIDLISADLEGIIFHLKNFIGPSLQFPMFFISSKHVPHMSKNCP